MNSSKAGTGFVKRIGRSLNRDQGRGRCLAGGAAAVAYIVASAAYAQATDDDLKLAEITVTAEHYSTDLQKTPVAVGTLGGAAIQDRDTSQIRDLPGLVAGLYIPPTASESFQPVYIRGIGTAAPIYNAAVGIYVDDVYIARVTNSAAFGSPDLDRIEVLRGPQGTLYGQNSSAGAIKIISKDPSQEQSAWLSVAAGNYDDKEAKAYFTGPIVADLLSYGVAYEHQSNEGYVYNKTLDHYVGALQTDQLRGKLKFTPSEGISFVLTAETLHDRSDNASGTPVNYPGTGPRITFDDQDLEQHDDNSAVSLRSEFDLSPHLKLRSISAYREMVNSPSLWSSDGVPEPLSGFYLDISDYQLSQEFQLLGQYDRLDFSAGTIGFRERYDVNRPSWAAGNYNGIQTSTLVKSAAVYAQAHYKLTDKFGITAGLRYTEERDGYDWLGYKTDPSLQYLAITGLLTNQVQKTNGVLPKIGIDYEVAPDVFTYASVTKGSKAGGFNPVPAALAVAEVPVDPEKVTTYELGAKTDLFSERLRSNVALFYNDFSDYQAVVNNPIVNGVPLNVSVIVNAGKARTYGAEFENTARVTRDLEWRLDITELRTEFLEFEDPTGAASTNYKGNQLNRSPHLTVGTGFSYHVPLSIPGTVRWDGDLAYATSSYDDIGNTIRIPPNSTINTGLFYTTSSRHWTYSASVRNVMDKTFIISRTNTPSVGADIVTYNQPRTFLVGVRYDF